MDNNTDSEKTPLLLIQSSSDNNSEDLHTTTHTIGSESSRTPIVSDTDSDVEYRICNISTKYLGHCCAILGGLFFTLSNAMIKYLPSVTSWELLIIRSVVQLGTMITIMVVGKHKILGTPDFATRWRVLAQGLLGGFLILALFEAIARVPLGDCTAIFFSCPAFTMVGNKQLLLDNY